MLMYPQLILFLSHQFPLHEVLAEDLCHTLSVLDSLGRFDAVVGDGTLELGAGEGAGGAEGGDVI